MTGKPFNIFLPGPIPMDFIAQIILQQKPDGHTGAYSIFLGQVRADESGATRVKAVDYTSYPEMAIEKFNKIKISLLDKYPLTGLHAYHSLGIVQAGEICFFVLAASEHRGEAIMACNEAVERIKSEVAIWGKLLLENDTTQWKKNT